MVEMYHPFSYVMHCKSYRQHIEELVLRQKLFVVICLILLSLPAIAQGEQPTGELTVALPNDPTSLYTALASDRTALNAAWQLYDSLVFVDENGELQPALAESWQVSDDGLSYTFTLRQGVTFHNGEPFTAADVVTTWEQGSVETNDWSPQFTPVTAINVIDDFTVEFQLEEPAPLLLRLMAFFWGIIPNEYVEEVGIDAFAQAPIGTGPFQFEERLIGDRIVMSANTSYWREGSPNVERVIFRIIPDSTTRLAAAQTGEVDIAPRLSVDEAGVLDAVDSVDVISYPVDRIYYLAFKNVNSGEGSPVEDVRVRQALNYAVDTEGIIAAIFGGAATQTAGFVSPSNLGFDESLQPYAYDPDLARELLAEAGFAEGFEIAMGCPSDAYLNINEVCLAIQSNLEDVGVSVNLEIVSTNTFWSEPQYGAVGPIFVDSWSVTVGEALERLTGALTPGAYYNNWVDEELVDRIDTISVTVDEEERAALYQELQQYMYDNPPFIYLYIPNSFEAVNSRVQGYTPYASEQFFLQDVSVSG